MRPLSPSLLATVAMLAACGCSGGSATLSSADMHANQSLVNEWTRLLMAKKFDSLALLYTADANVLPPNAPVVHGREAIQRFMAGFPSITAFRAVDDTIDGAGTLAYARGRYWMTFGIAGAPSDSGKFVEIRRKQADGSWKLEVDMFNSNVPTAAPEVPAPDRHR